MNDSTAEMADLLVTETRLVTMDQDRTIYADGAVAIRDGAIVAVGTTTELGRRFPDAARHDGRDTMTTPGYVNGHQHLTGDPLTRSCIPDNLPPGGSIFTWSVPVHGAHQPPDDELTAMATTLEGLLNGVTTSIEAGTIAHLGPAVAGISAVGGRAAVGPWAWDSEGLPFAAPVDETLDRLRDNLDAYPVGGRIEGWVTLVGHDLCSDELLSAATDLARERGTSLTMHLSPTSSDPESYLRRTGRRPVEHLRTLGVLGPHLLLAHGVWLDDDEIDLVLEHDVAIAFCPWAYLRMGQGVCTNGRHAEISKRGGRIALGCDASNAGDQVDILRTAALAAGLAKDARIDGTWFGAHEAFEWATINGAQAVGMGDRVGSIEVGKRADLVLHDVSDFRWIPDGDPALQLVWGTDGRSVRDVFVDGEQVVSDGRSTQIDEAELAREVVNASRAVLSRAGIDEVPIRWPVVRS